MNGDMGYAVRVPFRLGQKVVRARIIGNSSKRTLELTQGWTVAGYKLDEDGTLWAMCYKLIGRGKHYEYLEADSLYSSGAAALKLWEREEKDDERLFRGI